jgi:hypothetical protein
VTSRRDNAAWFVTDTGCYILIHSAAGIKQQGAVTK